MTVMVSCRGVAFHQKLKNDLERLLEDHATRGVQECRCRRLRRCSSAMTGRKGLDWATKDVKVVKIKWRTAKEGLRFFGDAPPALILSNNEKDNKNKEKKEKSEKEKVVRIVGGRDAGLKGNVVFRIGDDYLVLELSRSGEKVKIKVGDVVELGSKEEEMCLRKLKELKTQREDKVSKSKRGRDEVEEKRGDVNRRKEKRVDVGRKEERRVVDHRKVSWLTSHIRVRVISRDLKGGRLYLKKGEVLDVVGPTTCDISMDENREIVQGVSQDVLETVIPKRGGPVLVLAGKYKGVYGSMAERDLDQETAIVRDADTHELLNVKLEQIAEYIGDPSLLGH